MKKKVIPFLSGVILAGCLAGQKTPEAVLEPTPTLDNSQQQAAAVISSEPFKAGQEIGPGQSWDTALGDFNGDGYLDIFVAGLDPESEKIWFNAGDGTFVGGDQPLDACARGAVEDLNADGALDLVIGNWVPGQELWTDSLQIWLNDGTGVFEQGEILAVGSGTHTFALGDLDGDGDPDLFAVGSGKNSVWLNQGQGEFEKTDQVLSSGIDAAVGLGDLDGDGDLDALSGGWEGLPSVWLNAGSGQMEKVEQTFSDPELHIHGLALGDLDSDQDLDVFLVLANGEDHQVWINDGTGKFTVQGYLSGPLGHDIALGDLDGDGDLDAVSAHGYQSRGNFKVWLNDGSGQFTPIQSYFGEYFTAAVALGDLDQDGDLDIFAAANDWDDDPGSPDQVWINQNRFVHEAAQIELRKEDAMTMVFVPGGNFMMGGSERDRAVEEGELPAHQVDLNAFWIDQTEVTNRQYILCVNNAACAPGRYADNDTYNADDLPAVGVTWQNAQDYCAWVGGRLPTEAEWEYAAKGPQHLIYPWGNEYDGYLLNACDQNCSESWANREVDDGFSLSAPVGSFPDGASWVGAYDLAGNVWEWVQDWCGPYSANPENNPVGPEDGQCKIIRGGAWASPPEGVRTTYRMPNTREIKLETRHPNIGFRCVIPIQQGDNHE